MKNSSIQIETIAKLGSCLLITAFLLTGCQSPASRQDSAKLTAITGDNGSNTVNATPVSNRASTPDTTSLKGDWFLQDVKGSSGATLKTPYIRFDTAKSSFTGNTGCNTMKGLFWYSDADTSLVFGDRFVTTKMACPGNDEHAFIRNLMNTNHYVLKNSELQLLSEDGHKLSVWRRAPGAQTQKTARL